MTGSRLPVKEFFKDLFASGPASPLLSLMIRIASAMTGELFLLWVAGVSAERASHLGAFTGMGLVLAVFGVGAMLGPTAGRWLRRIGSAKTVLLASALVSGAILLLFGLFELTVGSSFILGFGFVLAITILNRGANGCSWRRFARQKFKGTRFVRINELAYSFGALGTISWLADWLLAALSTQPVACLFIGGILWVCIGVIVNLKVAAPAEA